MTDESQNVPPTPSVLRKWPMLLVGALIGAVVSVGVTLVRPAEYAGHMTVFFPSRPSVLGSNTLVDSGGGALALAGGGGATPLRVFQAFLESETAVRDICASLKIPRKDFNESRGIFADPRTSLLSVTYTNTKPEFARKVLQSHVQELQRINSKVSYSTVKDDLRVLKDRMDAARKRIDELQTQLVSAQRTTISAPTLAAGPDGVTSTPGGWAQLLIKLQLDQDRIDRTLTSSKALVQTLSRSPNLPSDLPPVKRLRPRILDLTYEIETKRRTLGPEAPEVTRLEDQLQVAQNELQKEIKAYLQGVNQNLIEPTTSTGPSIGTEPETTEDAGLPKLLTRRVANEAQIAALRRLADAAPAESMKLNKLYGQIGLQSTIVQTLTNQYLTASLQAQRDPNRWVVLDDPYVDEKPTNKSFSRMGLMGALLGALAALLLVMRRP